jgi:YD repeat-containing protein
VSSQLSQIYDGNNTHKDTAETYTYDQYGNMVQKVSLGEVLGADDGSFTDINNDKFIENILYVNNTSNYIVGLPYTDTVLDQEGNKIRETKMYYDNFDFGLVGLGNETKRELWKNETIYTNTRVTYNSYGLPLTSVDERGGITKYIYDEYNLYPVTIKDPLNKSTQFLYDYASGKVKQITDQNNFIFQTSFDGFGRVLEEKVPDLVSPYALVLKTKYVYSDVPLSVGVKKMDYLDDVNVVDTYQYFDGFVRPIQERKEMEE